MARLVLCGLVLALVAVGACDPPDSAQPVVGDAGAPGGGMSAGSDAGHGSGSSAGSGADPLAAYAALPPMCSDSGWCWLAPKPSGVAIAAAWSSSDNVWLTGGNPPSFAVILQWNGQEWISHRPPTPEGYPPYLFPEGLVTDGPNNAWLAYENLLEHWDGTAWTIVDTVAYPYNDIWLAPNGDPWVTTQQGEVLIYHNGVVSQTLPLGIWAGAIWGTAVDDVFITSIDAIIHYDGSTFSEVFQGKTAGEYQGVRDDVWVSGGSGAILHWDGSAMTDMSSLYSLPEQNEAFVFAAEYQGPDDITWISNADYNPAPLFYLHWDGQQFATIAFDTQTSIDLCGQIYEAGVIDGRWWITCAMGAVATMTRPATLDSVIHPFVHPGEIWGTSLSHMYLSDGGGLYFFDGTTWADLGHRLGDVAGLAGAGSGGSDELFGVRLEFSDSIYSAYIDHFDGVSWTSIFATQFPLSGPDQGIYKIYPLGHDEAIAVGGMGTAFHYQSGVLTPIATGTTNDLSDVWGPDSDHLWIVGTGGTFLKWERTNPGVFTPDPSFPTTTDNLKYIAFAGTTMWIVLAADANYVYRKPATGPWETISMSLIPVTIAATDDDNVVLAGTDSGTLGRWNGSGFDIEYYPSGDLLDTLATLPDGTMVLSGFPGLIWHPAPASVLSVKSR